MYPSFAMSAIIAEHKSTPASVPYKERLRMLAERLTDRSYATHQCSLALDKVYYCYVYLDPRKPGKFRYTLPSGKAVTFKHQPFYVGKGKGGRIDGHISEARSNWAKGRNTRKLNTIRKIQAAGLEPIRIATASKVDEAMALAYEIDLIAGIGKHNDGEGPLANLDQGGLGISGHQHTRKHRQHMSDLFKGRRMYHMTDEIRAKISKTLAGRPKGPLSEETKARIGAKARGRVMSEAACEANRQGQLGKTLSEDHKEKVSRSMKEASARPNSHINATSTCPHCDRTGRGPGFIRWHFDRCRDK